MNQFDTITRFRLYNAFAVVFGLNLLIPVINDLRGELHTSSVIALMMIATTLAVKINSYLTKYSISFNYKLGNIFHLLLTVCTLLYFVDVKTYIYVNAALQILEIGIFSSYSIQLDEYLAKTNPTQMGKFRIYQNSKKADAILAGLGTTAVLTYFFNIEVVILCFLVYNTLFSAWLMYNWNFFNKL